MESAIPSDRATMKFSNPVGEIAYGFQSPLQAYSNTRPFYSIVASGVRYPVLPNAINPPGSPYWVGYLISDIQLSAINNTISYATITLDYSTDGVNFTPFWRGFSLQNSVTVHHSSAPVTGIQLPGDAGVWVRTTDAGALAVNLVYAYGTPQV